MLKDFSKLDKVRKNKSITMLINVLEKISVVKMLALSVFKQTSSHSDVLWLWLNKKSYANVYNFIYAVGQSEKAKIINVLNNSFSNRFFRLFLTWWFIVWRLHLLFWYLGLARIRFYVVFHLYLRKEHLQLTFKNYTKLYPKVLQRLWGHCLDTNHKRTLISRGLSPAKHFSSNRFLLKLRVYQTFLLSCTSVL